VVWTGIERDPDCAAGNGRILTLDLVRDDPGPDFPPAGLVWCVEVLEHIPRDDWDRVMAWLKIGRYALLTVSDNPEPEGHVSPASEAEVIGWMAGHRWIPETVLTEGVRKSSTMRKDFVRKAGLVFFNPSRIHT